MPPLKRLASVTALVTHFGGSLRWLTPDTRSVGAQDARSEDRARAGVRITAFGRGSPPAAEGERTTGCAGAAESSGRRGDDGRGQ